MSKDMGVPPSGSGSRPADGAESAFVSTADAASIPNAGEYATFVFWHPNAEAATALARDLTGRFPFGSGDQVTCLTGLAVGDVMSKSDAIRMALECRALDSMERRELALELCECISWEDCLKVAADRWELREEDGEFRDMRDDPPAPGIEAPSGDETRSGSAEGESAVPKADAQ